jgi:hypothetical protein
MVVRTDWFVVGFTRRAKGPARAEVIVRASGNQDAHRLAASFAASFGADNGSAVVLSGDCFSSRGERGGLRVEAKFGHVPDDPQEWGLGRLVMPMAGASQLLEREITSHQQIGAVASTPPDRLRRTTMGVYRRATLIAGAMAALATSVTAIRAHDDRRHSRLMEMARPHCDHEAVSARDLHRLVHHALVHSHSKHDALFTVVAQCRQGAGRASLEGLSQSRRGSHSCATS